MVREKLELEIIIEVRTEELEKPWLEILKSLQKLEKIKLKKLRELHKVRVEIESIERLDIEGIVQEFHELANYQILF